MAAICDSCHWTGAVTTVRYGGYCPKCGERIRYDRKPLPAQPAITADEFIRRAPKVLRAAGADSSEYVSRTIERLERGSITAPELAVLLKVVLRHADQISDRAVIDFATMHAKGAD